MNTSNDIHEISGLFLELDGHLISGEFQKFEDNVKTLERLKLSMEDKLRLERAKVRRLWANRDYENALKKLKLIIKKSSLPIGSNAWAEHYLMLTALKVSTGGSQSAENDLLAILEKLDDDSDIKPWILFDIACVIRDQGKWDQARNIILNILKIPGTSLELASRASLFMAQLLLDLELVGIEQWTAYVIQNAPKWGGWELVKLAQIIEAMHQFRAGDYGNGLRLLTLHLQEADQIGYSNPRLRVRLAIAESLIILGDYTAALEYLKEAKDILDTLGNSGLKTLQPVAELLWFRASTGLEDSLDVIWEAIDRLEIILAVIAKYSRPPGTAPFWLELGHLQARTGSSDVAHRAFLRAQTEAADAKSASWEGLAYFTLADFEWKTLSEELKQRSGDRNRILAWTSKALEVITGIDLPELEWQIHYLRGKIYAQSGEQYPANGEMELAARILIRLISSIRDPSLQKTYRSVPHRKSALFELQPYLARLESIAEGESSFVVPRERVVEVSDQSEDIRRLQAMLEALYEIHSSATEEDLIQRCLKTGLQIFKADRIRIQLTGIPWMEKKVFTLTKSRNPSKEQFPISMEWIREIDASRSAIIFQRDPDEEDSETRSVMMAPLIYRNFNWGMVYLDRLVRESNFETDEMDLLRTIIQASSIAYSSIRMRHRLSELTAQFRRDIIPQFPRFVGESDAMREIFIQIQKVASAEIPILITGETGTGKDITARTIHEISSRANAPFVHLDCSSIPISLLEAELFGIERGVATGVESRIGLLEYANGGTILLDEVADIPLNIQAKLLRVLQEREFEPLGSDRTVRIDIRILSTTSQDLESYIQEDKMREDFYYRISGVVISLPPLRARVGDVLLLSRVFLQKYNTEFKKNVLGFDPIVLDTMAVYPWPGNVRELDHRIRKAVLFCQTDRISMADIGLLVGDARSVSLEQALVELDREAVLEALAVCQQDISKASERLEISPDHLEQILSRSDDSIKKPEGV